MSGNGRLRALLEARRREELRKNRVRSQCTNLLNILEQKMQQYETNANISHFLAEDASAIRTQWQKAQQLLQIDPDEAWVIVEGTAVKVNSAITNAMAGEKAWSLERQQAEQLLQSTLDHLEALPLKTEKLNEKHQLLVQQVKTLQQTATTSEVIQTEIETIKAQSILLVEEDKETEVRKEIIKSILIGLKKQGFIVSTPKLKQNVVHVTGKMLSGKMALFQIYDDTSIKFALEGYTGTACKQELDAVLEIINTESNVETSIEQFVWHNPDKIRKGSKEFPTPVGQMRTMKK